MKIWIGYDPREDIAAEVCRWSIEQYWPDAPVSFLALDHPKVSKVYSRKWSKEKGLMVDDLDGRPFSTEFAFSRFLVPYLCDYEGWALFVDCDMLFQTDPRDILEYADDQYACVVVQHHHIPKETHKMDGCVQQIYRRKNWSSVMLWNCGHKDNARLGPDLVNTRTGSFLHQFAWLHDHRIGALPEQWNWLCGVSPTTVEGAYGIKTDAPKILHYTEGGPWFPGFENCEYSDQWNKALEGYKIGRDTSERMATGST